MTSIMTELCMHVCVCVHVQLTCVAKCLVDNVDIVEIEEDELLNVQLG